MSMFLFKQDELYFSVNALCFNVLNKFVNEPPSESNEVDDTPCFVSTASKHRILLPTVALFA